MRKRVRRLRDCALVDLDFGRSRDGGGGRASRSQRPLARRRDRRRGAYRRHGARGAQRRGGLQEGPEASHHPERQRLLDFAARGRTFLAFGEDCLDAHLHERARTEQEGPQARSRPLGSRQTHGKAGDQLRFASVGHLLGVRPQLLRTGGRPQPPRTSRSAPKPSQARRSLCPARRDEEGKGLSPRGSRSDDLSRRRQVRSRRRHSSERETGQAHLHAGLRTVDLRPRRKGSDALRDHSRHARGFGARRIREALSDPLPRRGDCGAARRHLCGRVGDDADPTGPRHLFEFPAACDRSGDSRRGAPEPPRALCDRPRRPRGRRRGDAPRGLRHRTVAEHSEHGRDDAFGRKRMPSDAQYRL